MVKITFTRSSLVLAFTAALAAAGSGCNSNRERTVKVDETANSIEQNRSLVRMALAENVYNGVAAERAIYPKDFEHGSTKLNTLGTNRLDMLINVCREGNGRIVVIRGEESSELYDERVKLIENQLAHAGFDTEQVSVAKNSHVSGGSASGERAIAAYSKMMTSYQPGQQQSAPAGGGGFGSGLKTAR
jgi:hypothetical protein